MERACRTTDLFPLSVHALMFEVILVSIGSWRFSLPTEWRILIRDIQRLTTEHITDSTPNGGSHSVTYSGKRTRGTQQRLRFFQIILEMHKHVLAGQDERFSWRQLLQGCSFLFSTSHIVLDIFRTDLGNFFCPHGLEETAETSQTREGRRTRRSYGRILSTKAGCFNANTTFRVTLLILNLY